MVRSAALILLAAAAPAQTPSLQETESSVSALLDRAEGNRDLDRTTIDKISNLATTLWFVCIGKTELRLHNSKDEVATIATAILGSCNTDEQLFVRSARLYFRTEGPAETDRYVDKIDKKEREDMRERVITYLVNYRLKQPK